MKKYMLLCFALLLTACSDSNEKATWVAQNIPKEQHQPAPTYPVQVDVYSPNVTTTGQVIQQKDREKWILVNAQDVAGHPNVLVHHELLTLGEVEAIDEVNNIALIHIRNSYHYETAAIDVFTTTRNGEQITATTDHIDRLLKTALETPIEWQQRYKKNQLLLEGVQREELQNFTSFYSKNLFTYNSDDLKQAATHLIDTLNLAIEQQQFEQLNLLISSDDVKKEIAFVNKPIQGFSIKGAKKEGVYYFVNGVDETKNEVRLTFILEGQTYKLIGANLINSDAIQQQQIPTMDATKQIKLKDAPALEMFANKHLTELIIETKNITWRLSYKDSAITVHKNEKLSYSCNKVQIKENAFQLMGCGPQKATVPIVQFK